MDSIAITKMSDTATDKCNQLRVKVGEYTVAYVCYGRRKPINFLPRHISGLQLTKDEKLEVACYVRSEMKKINAKRFAKDDELARLTSPDYDDDEVDQAEEETNQVEGNENGIDQGEDSGSSVITQD